MLIQAYIHHKKAEKYSDCQDYFGIDTQNNRIAISDGMSQSIFPQWWSKILVDYYLGNGQIPHAPQDILPLQKKWQQMLHDEISNREEEAKINPKRNPWRLKNLLAEKSGAGATLCGLTIGKNILRCDCIGDSCLIAINHDYTLNFYTSQVGEFGNHPDYLDSFKSGRGRPISKEVKLDIKALLLASDPIAELFLIHENDSTFIKSRLEELVALSGHSSYVDLVEKWRNNFDMHNDDSTLVLIQDIQNSNLVITYEDNLAELCTCEADEGKKQIRTANLSSTQPTDLNFKVNIPEDASKRFIDAFESLLIFYDGKKKEKQLKKWIYSILKTAINNFTNK